MPTIRSALLFAAVLAVAASCGSDDGSDTAAPDDAAGTTDDSTDDAGSGDSSDDDSSADGSAEGGGTSTITVDGTTHELDVGDCEGSNTDASGFPFPDNFSLSGSAVDADLQFNIARNGPADELFVQVGALEGDGDETGGNETLVYRAVMETLEFTVDGPDVSGTVTVSAIGPTRPYGDETVVDFSFDC